jgi:hemin uptake protein HemP
MTASHTTTTKASNPANSRLESAANGQAPLHSTSLLRGSKTVAITHNGMLYTLQATKLGKLILTK